LSYRCSICGELHDELPHVGSDRPDPWWDVPEDERDRRIALTGDSCIIDDEQFFIRGVIEIPVHDHADCFGIGVWVSQKKENFFAYLKTPDSAQIGPYFGWLCTRVSYYQEDSTHLKTMAHFRAGNMRPAIELEPTDHPLAIDQRTGITEERAWEIVHYYLNPDARRAQSAGSRSDGRSARSIAAPRPGIERDQPEMLDDWPFDQPRNCAVFTIRQIVDFLEPILHVRHDLDDNEWQFLGQIDAQSDDLVIVGFEEVVERDCSLRELADLPAGWHAWRSSPDEPWIREPIPLADDD
jgi:hypothetical protein